MERHDELCVSRAGDLVSGLMLSRIDKGRVNLDQYGLAVIS